MSAFIIMDTPPDTDLDIQIKALLNGFRRSSREPKMSLEELAVAVITVNQDMTLLELQRHILSAFKYYNNASVESSITRGYQGSTIISHFNTTFATLLRRFDLPIDVLHYESDNDEDDDDDELYVSPSAAQIFLQKHLTDGKKVIKKPFPFLKLPCELRLQIYGHCLGLPKSGVAIRRSLRHSMKKEVVVRTKDFDAELQIADWEDLPAPTGVRARWDNFEFRNRHDGTLTCQDLRKHLALLSVNKEIYNEAMPVFYSINSFVCSDLMHLEEFLATLAPQRREQLRHISFFYTKTSHSKAAKAFKMLGEIEKLKRLDIMINEADFVHLTKAKGERVFPDVLKLPGFHTLKSMRAVKTVQFHGECDTIREALQSWVVDNETKAEQPKKPRKKSTKPRVAKKMAKTARVAADEQEDQSLVETATAEPSVVEDDASDDANDAQDPFQDTAFDSPMLSSPHYDPSSPKPSTPRTSGGLWSPFRFKPNNAGSYLASRFQAQSPSHGRANSNFAIFDEPAVASGASTPSIWEQNDSIDQEAQQIFDQLYSGFPPMSYPEGYRPVQDIATRMMMHGPGQMLDWKPVKPAERLWVTLPQGAAHGTGMAASQVGVEHQETGALKMEDLVAEHDDYELLQ